MVYKFKMLHIISKLDPDDAFNRKIFVVRTGTIVLSSSLLIIKTYTLYIEKMPKDSERKKLLKSLLKQSKLRVMMRLAEGASFDEIDILNEVPEYKAYLLVSSNRYLTERVKVARAPSRFEWLIYDLDDERFKQICWMTRDSFFALYDLIKDDDVYAVKSSKSRQVDVRLQMVVALERFGTNGNGASVGRIARGNGVSGK